MTNGHEPATKADLAALEERLTQSLTEAFTEAIHDSETRLSNSFYGFTQSIQARFQASDHTEVDLKRRMAVVEDRLLEVEKRLNMPGDNARQ